jgi:hypothetical protein
VTSPEVMLSPNAMKRVRDSRAARAVLTGDGPVGVLEHAAATATQPMSAASFPAMWIT